LKEDWDVSVALAGLGYAAFSLAMAIMRLLGDRLVMRLDSKKVVVYGCLFAAAGFHSRKKELL
jgi:predicted MFS family arabinose efflux permease